MNIRRITAAILAALAITVAFSGIARAEDRDIAMEILQSFDHVSND